MDRMRMEPHVCYSLCRDRLVQVQDDAGGRGVGGELDRVKALAPPGRSPFLIHSDADPGSAWNDFRYRSRPRSRTWSSSGPASGSGPAEAVDQAFPRRWPPSVSIRRARWLAAST